MLSSLPLRGSNINWTNVLSYSVYCFSFTLLLLIGDTLTPLIHVCWLVHLNSNWAHFSRGHEGPRQAYLTVGSSEGTEEEQEPLDRSLASSCSPGPAVAKAPFDVIHLRRLALIMSASGTPWPPPTLHTDDSDKWSYKHTPHPLRPLPYLLWNHTGTENSQSHIPLYIKVDKRMKGFVYKQFK